jgi:glutathione S-transferase
VLELFQAEWCPHSHRVRMRLTELGLDWCARNVALEPEQRDAMAEATGVRSIPTLKHGDVVVSGADPTLAYLDVQFAESPDGAPSPQQAGARRMAALARAAWELSGHGAI